MLHLAVLVANPGQEVEAVDLVAGLSALAATVDTAASKGGGARRWRSPLAQVPSQPVLDPAAIREYRQRLAQLQRDIDESEAGDDAGGAAKARAERDWITAELAAAAGIAGRTRDFPTNRERARIAVGKAIRRVLDRIATADPVIGDHLTRSIRTGARCSYWPA
jgi:hypothetical protein